LEANLEAIRPQAGALAAHGADWQTERARLREDARADLWIERGRCAGRVGQRAAAEHELVAAWDDVEDAIGIAVIGDRDGGIDAAALGDHDLAEQRIERVVAREVARAEAGAVDDD